MTEMNTAPDGENAVKNPAEWVIDDGVNWRSYVEGTRGKYVDRYASLARQDTNNYSRLEEELANMMNAAEQAGSQRAYTTVLEMAGWLWSSGGQFLDLQGHMEEALELLTQAVGAARSLGDKSQEENLLGQLGRVWMALRKWPTAIECFEQALTIAREIGDRQGEASHLGNLGQLQLEIAYETGYLQGEEGLQKEYQQKAAGNFQEAAKIAREIGDRQMEGRLSASLGWVKLRNQILVGYTRERTMEAIELFKSAVAIARETGDQRGEASHLGSLGGAYELMAIQNLSLPPFFWGSPYPGEDADRYRRYQEEMESANRESYRQAYTYYSNALSMAGRVGDVQMQARLGSDRARVGTKANFIPTYPGGDINMNIWMRNQPAARSMAIKTEHEQPELQSDFAHKFGRFIRKLLSGWK